MNSSLNHIFRTIWSEALGAWVAVSEITKAKGKRSVSSLIRKIRILDEGVVQERAGGGKLKPILFCVVCCFAFNAQANPAGGAVVNGQASFNTSGNTLTVTNTPGTIINWQGFSINSNEVTHFAQQSAASAVLNRVVTNNPSVILGTLSSNGQVYLVNPGGIVFGAGSTVDVAGLVATSLNLSNADFLAGNHHYTPAAGAQNVSNAGNITAQQGGQIYLIAPNVENSGVITAPNGEILLAAGHEVQLVNSLDPNLRVNITAPAGDATNIGQLVASAGRLGLFGAVVRNTGKVSADSATLQGGKIVFRASQQVDAGGTASAQGVGGGEIKVLADMQNGTANVTGTLDASAPDSGNGGFIETSAAHVQVADTARVTTLAAHGNNGNWLIDPTDYTISAVDPANGSSWMSNSTLATNLGSSNITIQTLASGTGNGDIFVYDNVDYWPSANSLTLNAIRDVNIYALINSGTGNLIVRADLNGSGIGTISFYGGGYIGGGGYAHLYYNPSAYTTPNDYSSLISPSYTAWMLVNDVNQLQAMNTNLTGTYALGTNIDATATATWNTDGLGGYYGFAPVGDTITRFTGTFDGLGHTISNLSINRPAQNDIGMFGYVGEWGVVNNVSLSNPTLSGSTNVGALAGVNGGIINNDYVNGGVVSGATYVGGLVGSNISRNAYFGSFGVITASKVTNVSVTGSNGVGGLAGLNRGGNGGVGGPMTSYVGAPGSEALISNSYVSGGTVSGNNNVGGLVGLNQGGDGGDGGTAGRGGNGGAATIINSNVNSVSVNGINSVGGLVGNNVGGNAGMNVGGSGGTGGSGNVEGSFVNGGSVSGSSSVGGLVGYSNSIIGNSHVSNGTVTATKAGLSSATVNVGGLVGYNAGDISNSYASSGSVTSTGSGSQFTHANAGGLVGNNAGSISNSYVSGGTVQGNSGLGGLVGSNSGNISNTYVNGGSVISTTTDGTGNVGGLVGDNTGSISNSYSSNGVVCAGAWNCGGVVAHNYSLGTGTVTNTFWDTTIAAVPGGPSSGIGSTASGNGTPSDVGATGMVTADFFVNANFTSATLANGNVNPAWDFTPGTGTWYMVDGNTRPFLRSEYSTTITNAHQLQLVGMDATTLAASYTLANNIDLAPALAAGGMWNTDPLVNANGNTGFVPIGATPMFPTYGTPFSGQFNGQNFTISNLTINRPLENNVGLFGYAQHATISNLGLLNVNVTGQNAVGGLVGYLGNAGGGTGGSTYISGNPSVLSNSYVNGGTVTGSASGGTDVGGLVGNNYGSNIDGSHVENLAVTGDMNVGGLVGNDSGEGGNFGLGMISNSHALNTQVTGWSNVGGLVGRIGISTAGYNITIGNYDVVYNSYVDRGTVTSNAGSSSTSAAAIGGLVGFSNFGNITSSYVTNGTVVNGGFASDVGGLVGHNLGGKDSIWTGSATVTFDLGIVSNSYVSGGTVSGNNKVGGLVGMNMTGTIDSSNVSVATVTGNNEVGGLVGANEGGLGGVGGPGFSYPASAGATGLSALVSNSYVSGGTVSGVSNVGGLVGANIGGTGGTGGWGYSGVGGTGGTGGTADISNSNVSGTTVNATSSNVGGLVGYNSSGSNGSIGGGIGGTGGAGGSAVIDNSFVSGGNVSGASWSVGGLVGNNNGIISNSYVTGGTIVSGVGDVGGLVGHNQTVFSSGTTILSGGQISNSYVSSGSVIATGSNVGGLVGFNAGLMTNSHFDISAVTTNGGNNVTPGGLYATQFSDWLNNGSLVISNYSSLVDLGGGVYGVSTAQGMQEMLGFVDDPAYSFKLTGNVDLNSLPGFYVPVLAGNFDGAGFTVSNLSISLPNYNMGLFGEVLATGSVNNVGVLSASVVGTGKVGALAGSNAGNISNSFVIGGTVQGANTVGGLVGGNSGNISDTYVTGGTVISTTTDGYGNLGGLVGDNSGSISNSYANNGLVWSGAWNVGGVVGHSYLGTVTNTFWDTSMVGSYTISYGIGSIASGNGAPSDVGAAGLTSAQMQTMSSFTGWDIANTGGAGTTWRIYEGHTAPLLASFLTPLTVQGGNAVKVYDGQAFSGEAGFTYSIPSPVQGNLFGWAGTSQGAVHAGSYTIIASGLYSNQMGYDILSTTDGTLTVNPAPLSSTASIVGATSMTYNGATTAVGASVSGSVSGAVAGDSITLDTTGLALNYNSAHVASATTIGATGTTNFVIGSSTAGSLASDYSFTGPAIGSVAGSITPALLTITANDLDKNSGMADPLFTYVLSGLYDPAASVLSGALARDPGEAVGTYSINQGSLSLTSSDYTTMYVPGAFTILAAAQTGVNDSMSETFLRTLDSEFNSLGSNGNHGSKSQDEKDKEKTDELAAEIELSEGGTGTGLESLPICR